MRLANPQPPQPPARPANSLCCACACSPADPWTAPPSIRRSSLTPRSSVAPYPHLADRVAACSRPPITAAADRGPRAAPGAGAMAGRRRLAVTALLVATAFAAAACASARTPSGRHRLRAATSQLPWRQQQGRRGVLSASELSQAATQMSAMRHAMHGARALLKSHRVTGILLNYKRDTIPGILGDWAASGVVSEAIVWNNQVEANFTSNASWPHMAVRVVNPRQNTMTMGKYLACAQALHPVCFWQDDDFNSTGYISQLYHTFLQDPDSPHVATNHITQADHEDRGLIVHSAGLHARWNWIGCGTFAMRYHAEKFLELLSAAPPEISRDHADIAFTLWTNRLPTVFVVDLVAIPSPNDRAVAISARQGFQGEMLAAAKAAFKHLQEVLINDTELIGCPFPAATRDYWALCARQDCAFMTRAPASLPTRPQAAYLDAQRGLIGQEMRKAPKLGAVDGNLTSCYSAGDDAGADSYFGLDMFWPHTLQAVHVSVAHPLQLQMALVLEVSLNNKQWQTLALPSSSVPDCTASNGSSAGVPVGVGAARSDVLLQCAPSRPGGGGGFDVQYRLAGGSTVAFRFVRFRLAAPAGIGGGRFSVCDLSVSATSVGSFREAVLRPSRPVLRLAR